jgi:hypothetical protein
MPSSGTGSDISLQEAKDLLSKYIEESTKLQAVFDGRGGVTAGLTGFLKPSSNVQLKVTPDPSPDAPFLTFAPSLAESFKYAAGRAVPNPTLPEAPRFPAALVIVYPDGSQIALFEIEE